MRSPRVLATAVVLVAVAGLATATVAQTGRAERPRVDRATPRPRADPPTVCQPTWPTSLSGTQSYYSVVIQLQNCQAADIPLSIDLGPYEGQGTSLAGAGGVDAKGTSVLWSAGTGATSSTAVTAIPRGDGIGGVGALVGFTTVPYWDGTRGAAPGPYANTIDTTDPTNQTNTPNIRGSWAVYLPSATFELDLQEPLPFPYLPQYEIDGQPPDSPGTLFTGILVTRSRPGGLQDPIFTTSSAQGYGQSPPSSSFVPGNCYDPVSLVNGANAGYATTSNWSFRGIDENAKTFNFTPAGNDFVPFNDGSYQWPVLMLVSAFLDTNDGAQGELGLRDDTNAGLETTGPAVNTATSTVPHYLQIAVRNVDGVDCSGSGKVFDIPVAIGADLGGINLASAQLPGAVLANSDLTGASLTQVSLAAGTGDTQPNLSYADLSGTATTPTPAIGVNFEAAQLIGTDLSDMTLTRADFQNTNLLLADLQGSSVAQVNFGGARYCRTTLPDGSVNNDDCSALLTPQTPWTPPPDTAGCDPTTCVFVSLYNNTTRTLARGLDWCVDGRFASSPEPPTWVAPLVTGQFQVAVDPQSSGSTTTIKCGITFANGAAGKVRVVVDTTSGAVVPAIDSGTCFGATSDACLPHAADGTSAIKLSSTTTQKDGATFVDVIACEPAAYTTTCPTTAALPGV